MHPQPAPQEGLRVIDIAVAVAIVLVVLGALGGIVLVGLIGYLQERPAKAHLLDLLGIWVPIIGAAILGIVLTTAIALAKSSRSRRHRTKTCSRS